MRSSGFKIFLFLLTGGLMATAFDWLMEPVAVHLNYWKWLLDGSIPLYNYVCWFGVSVLLLVLYKVFSLDQPNRFARRLLLIQSLFFFILRMVL
jgi:putative membrane protein